MTPKEMRLLQEALKTQMPWSDFKGIEMDELPSSYLRWLSESSYNDSIATKAGLIWAWREDQNAHVED